MCKTTASAVKPAKVPEPKMADSPPPKEYVFKMPERTVGGWSHFSSLLLSGSVIDSVAELALLTSVTLAAVLLPSDLVNTPGSVSLGALSAFTWFTLVLQRLYNAYLEAMFFSFPQYRTQPVKEHMLQKKVDLCGRDLKQLDTLVYHDRMTMMSQLAFQLVLYYAIPGFYPDDSVGQPKPIFVRLARLLLHHYLMSFGMYWMHRSCHVVPFLWKNVHVIHHWATHPLSRNTYQDHWVDNLANEIVGQFAAQVLIPLDWNLFIVSRALRIMESLEKHSGTSCWLNLAHQAQSFLPYSNMPYHHDWHHEGHKASNFTFCAVGGLWDCIFGTRKAGRGLNTPQATSYDQQKNGFSFKMDQPMLSLAPVAAVLACAAFKLANWPMVA